MAFDVTITGLSSSAAARWKIKTRVRWTIDARWWRSADLIADPRFKDVSKDLSYSDYEAVITVAEAKALAAKYSTKLDHLRAIEADLDAKLADGRVDRVRITIAEWESGL